MSESVLRILLNELRTARVLCRNKIGSLNDPDGMKECGTITEVPIERLGNVNHCPVCGYIIGPFSKGPMESLAKSIIDLGSRGSEIEIQFVIPK